MVRASSYTGVEGDPVRGVFAPSLSLRSSSAQSDLEALLARMRRRLYPETIPVLASYWLKTVCAGGHTRGWWKELHELLKQVLREEPLNAPSREALMGVQDWIRQGGPLTGKTPGLSPPRLEPFRANLSPEWLVPYVARLLNEWLSAEVAGLMVNESESGVPPDGYVPVLAVGRALERLLVRERLSPETLEMLLQPELVSPHYVYPADAEVLHDVVLALLSRTWSPPLHVMPATVFGLGAESTLPPDFREMVCHASFMQRQGGEEIHVPIAAAQALEILKRVPIRIASILVTMDGRWWESETLQSGEQHSVVYKSGGRLRIDYSAEHAKLKVPWPDKQLCWSGEVRFRDPFEIFGREWHASSWETDGERTWLHLVFSRVLPTAKIQPASDTCFRRSRPASVDIAWDALGSALATAIEQKSREPIEQLRRSDFIPLGRAMLGLAESMKKRWQPKREIVETQLRGIRYLQAELSLVYGRIPWRILPALVRQALLKKRLEPALLDVLNEIFDTLPEVLSESIRQSPPSGQDARSTSPSRAAWE